MPTNTILSVGTSADSADFTIPAGGELDLYLTTSPGVEDIPPTAELLIQKLSGGNPTTHLRMNRNMPSCKLKGAGPWRAKRGVQDSPLGLVSET